MKIEFKNWKAFWISLIVVFIGVSITHFGVKMPKLQYSLGTGIVNPLPINQDVLEAIKPKLESKKSSFKLQMHEPLIRQASAVELDGFKSFAIADLETGEVLAGQKISEKMPIASITKIMTAVVALDLASPDQSFKISQKAADFPPTKIGMIPGQEMTLEELLNALLLTSANDGAEVIKEGIDSMYQDEVFVEAMNLKAESLGLKNSHFTNPQGFDHKDHYSSPEDLIILTQYALTNYPLIKSIVEKDYQFYPASSQHKQIDMYNWNGLLGVYPGVNGVKIGNTTDAGFTTVVTATREGKSLIAVGLGAPGVLQRDLWAAKLLDYGFAKLGIEHANITPEQLQQKYSTWKYWN